MLFRSPRREADLSYWREKLAGSQGSELSPDFVRPAIQTFRGGRVSARVTPEAREQVAALARDERASLFMVLLAAFKILLSRQSGHDDIVVGSPIANRTRVETEGLIGFFVNTLVLRTDLGGDPTAAEMVSRVRETAIGDRKSVV